MYDLCVDGIAGFLVRRPGLTRAMRRQPLAGLVDGSNKVFLCPMFPILATGLVVWLGTTQQTLNIDYTVDTATGTITFTTAPTVQPTADYTATQLSDQQIVYYMIAGFQLMESLWTRHYALSSSSTAYVMAQPTDSHIYLCQGPITTGQTPTDPVIGTQTFSQSVIQRSWLERCAEFAYLDSMTIESALSDVDIRERAGGVAITTSHRSQSIRQAKDALWNEVIAAMYAALDEFDGTMQHYGGTATQVHTNYYVNVWNWQQDGSLVIPTSLNQRG